LAQESASSRVATFVIGALLVLCALWIFYAVPASNIAGMICGAVLLLLGIEAVVSAVKRRPSKFTGSGLYFEPLTPADSAAPHQAAQPQPWRARCASSSPAPGTTSHPRGGRREPIYVDDDDDRRAFLDVLGQARVRFDAMALASIAATTRSAMFSKAGSRRSSSTGTAVCWKRAGMSS
jgi:hypothetical protein